MSCKIEIRKSIDASVNEILPYADSVVSLKAATETVNKLNNLWGDIATKQQYSSYGGYKILIHDIDKAVEREYQLQVEAEKAFKQDLDFFNGDVALYEQDQRDSFLQKKGETESSQASPKTIAIIRDFIKRIGVDVKSLEGIVIDGIKIDANGAALIMQKLIQVVDGMEARALPEEAMHFAVEIIQQKDPKLFNQLLKEINNYKMLNKVMLDYGQDKHYQTKDGKPDILKLKKEAIAKVLAETIIFQNEGSLENKDSLAKIDSWWSKILNSLSSLFSKSGFDTMAKNILLGKDIGTAADIKEEGVYLQRTGLEEQERIFKEIKATKNVVKKEEDGYSVDGKKVARRVSDIVKTWYDRQFAIQSLTKSEFAQSIDELKAEKGTAGHADIEYAFKVYVDETTGLLRDIPLDDSGYVSQINPNNREFYEMLRDNLKERLEAFDSGENKGTRFMAEAIVYDAKRNLAGTIDFLAITPKGKVSILDWKFMDLDIAKWEDIPWYKVNAWHLQMEQYKYLISSVYKVNAENFEQTRMIPIKAYYSEGDRARKILPVLTNIQIGAVNVQDIEDDYLLPVSLEGEKTGDDRIDNLLEKLNAIYKKMSKQKVSPEEKINKSEQLNALFSAIRQLQMKQNIKPLIYQSKVLNRQIQGVIDTYNNKFKGQNKELFSDQVISEFADIIETAALSLTTYSSLDTELEFLFEGKQEQEDKELHDELMMASSKSRTLAGALKKADTEYIVNMIGGTDKAEKIIRGIGKLFGTTGTLQLKALDVLYKKANKAFYFTSLDTKTEINRLVKIKESYQTWARSNGLTIRNQFNILKKGDTNELIDEFNSEFYSSLKEKQGDKNFKWIGENIDKEAYKRHLAEKLKIEYQRIEDKLRIGSEEQIDREITAEKHKAKMLYDASTPTSVGWLLYEEVKQFPKRETWESKEWKELHKPENKPALDFYNYIRERNDYYTSIGYINAKQSRVFLPWVRESFTERLIFNGDITIGEQFLRNISVDEGDIGYGQIDPQTGKPIDTIPKYFTSEIEGSVSTDLFKTMAMYNEFAIKFKYLSDIEAQARALVRLESNKKAIATSYFGKTQYDKGILQYNPDNSENTKLLTDMVKAIVYQQKYIESEAFDQLLGRIGSFGKTLNSKLGIKLLPENLDDRQLSVNKIITHLNTTFQLTALGFNTLSSMSNLFGGKTQSLVNSGKYYTKQDFIATEFWLLGNKLSGPQRKERLALLDFFMPYTENYNRDAPRDLSLNKMDDQQVQDWLMVLMRKSDRAVQITNFFSFMRNTIVEDGKVLNTREYLRTLPEYKDFYKGTAEERRVRSEKFEADVIRLNETKGIMKVGTIVNDEFKIPGVDQKDQSIVDLRRKMQQVTADALGSMTEENKRIINMTVYGNSFMVFKNWIPRLVDVRMGGLKYNSASDAYEWGRTRMIFKIISEDLLGSIGNLKNALLANDKGMAYVREMFEKKAYDYKQDTNKDLNMTETEFVNLVRQNIKNQLADVLFYAGLFALMLGLKAMAPDDDEDPLVKNRYRFLMKATDKFRDELGYFYNPASLTGLVSSGVFPAMGLLKSYTSAVEHFGVEMFALATGDEKTAKKNYVVKYWMKSFPVLNQMAGLMPLFYENMAKDLGIKMQSQYNRR